MAIARDGAYIWVTWITGVLAGDFHCEWSAWFRAHFRDFDKRPTPFNLAAWKAQHGVMVRERAETLRGAGYQVYIEEQNKFSLKGRAATLGGTPDLVASRGDETLVIDCKTGRQRNSDYFQVLTYMLVLPFTHCACHGRSISGEVQYRTQSMPIESASLTDAMKEMIKTRIERVGGGEPLPKVPSFGDCRYCDIGKADCPERIDDEAQPAVRDHALF